MNDNNQFVHNQEAFKLYKAKSYTKPYHENEYGWFDLSVEDIKKETIYEKGSDEITISIVHLPNDKWIATSTVIFHIYGYSSSPCIYDKEFSTRYDAIKHEINHILNFLSYNNANNKIISIVKKFLFTLSEAEMSLFSFLDCQ